MLQIHWESELENRLKRQIELRKEFEEKLMLKRQTEAEEMERRLQTARDNYEKCQEYLRTLLREKDSEKEKHLQNIRNLKVT